MDISWFAKIVRLDRAHALKRICKLSKFEHVWAFAKSKRAVSICRNIVAAFCCRDLENDFVRTDEDRVGIGQRVYQFNQESGRDIVPREDDVAVGVNVPVEARIAQRAYCVSRFFFWVDLVSYVHITQLDWM